MEDEIGSAEELFEAAELREVVMHQLLANRETGPDPEALQLPPEELHATGSPNEPTAAEFITRVGGRELGVRIAVQTRNAYAAFLVDVEAVFALPAPISAGKQGIVQQFIEQVGAPAVFPYIRSAVASLAAQLSVPASPLPLFNSVEMELATDEVQQHPDNDDEDRYVHGTYSIQMVLEIDQVGTLTKTDRSTQFMIDTQTQQLVQIGDDTLDVSEIDAMAQMLAMDPAVFWPHLRKEGDEAPIEERPASEVPEGVMMTGTLTRTAEDGTVEAVGEFFVDAETGSLLRVGGEGEMPDADELLNAIAELAASGPWVDLAHADELTWQAVIRENGIDSARQFVEDIREREDDDTADAALATMDSALRSIAIEDAVEELNSAFDVMAGEVAAAKEITDADPAEHRVPPALLVAAERVLTEWDAFKAL